MLQLCRARLSRAGLEISLHPMLSAAPGRGPAVHDHPSTSQGAGQRGKNHNCEKVQRGGHRRREPNGSSTPPSLSPNTLPSCMWFELNTAVSLTVNAVPVRSLASTSRRWTIAGEATDAPLHPVLILPRALRCRTVPLRMVCQHSLVVAPRYKLNIWDVGGQKTLRSYWRNYFEVAPSCNPMSSQNVELTPFQQGRAVQIITPCAVPNERDSGRRE